MAYASDESGQWEVYDLFFLSDGHLMAAPYASAGDVFKPGAPRQWSSRAVSPLLSIRNYDVMPDGKRVVALLLPDAQERTQAPAQVTVMLNFFDELRRKLP